MKIILLVFSSFFLIYYSFSQKVDTIQSSVIIISNDGSSNIKKDYKKPKNVIKAGLFRVFYGEFPIYYEREVVDFFCLEAGAGITFRNFYYDYINILRFFDDNYYDYSNYTNRKAKIGYCASVRPKFSFGNDGIEGWYMAFPFSYALHNYKAYTVEPDGTYTTASVKEKMKSIYLSLEFGGQKVFDPLVLDVNFGVGMWRKNEHRLRVNEVYDDIVGGYYYTNDVINNNKIKPYFTFGLSFGGVF